MKNRIGIWVLAAALVAPQALLWADESPAAGTPAPATASAPQTKKSGHKGQHHHKKMKKSRDAGASASGQPAAK